ncbi:GNAT family N-acetyltransferase [Streptomyces sp. NBC_01363]|uniref:GNAT family N-acetyltransferase n=1 Tax=Streptomyces sp. NBC_01363 TaxID=2903840 RepID=UPI00224FB461|nr:GNAT family N-acetyltransferase [Streptomyces sp. NBC_01363]MCX4730870.1 GNAT family N-acetyltransferase [Streptomyces sp. NBC_01363]
MPSSLPRPIAELPVRRLTPGDLVACADLCEDRGWPRDEHRWGLLLAAGTGYGVDDPGGKGLMASCVVTSYGPRLAAIGMLLVAERYARQGIARHLMNHVIAESGGTPLSLYATAAGQPLYEQIGFSVVGRSQRVTGSFRPADDRSSAVAVRPATAEDLRAMIRLDSDVFGTDRTHVLARLPAYADHIRVAQDEGRLIGYAAVWPSERTHVVGPLIARDTATAQALVASLAEATDLPLRVDVDARHTELLDWFEKCGLRPGASTTVMTLGASDLPGDWTRRYAPLTVATG